jgi:NAD/NADP transhydrogenase alpha subunit
MSRNLFNTTWNVNEKQVKKLIWFPTSYLHDCTSSNANLIYYKVILEIVVEVSDKTKIKK